MTCEHTTLVWVDTSYECDFTGEWIDQGEWRREWAFVDDPKYPDSQYKCTVCGNSGSKWSAW